MKRHEWQRQSITMLVLIMVVVLCKQGVSGSTQFPGEENRKEYGENPGNEKRRTAAGWMPCLRH